MQMGRVVWYKLGKQKRSMGGSAGSGVLSELNRDTFPFLFFQTHLIKEMSDRSIIALQNARDIRVDDARKVGIKSSTIHIFLIQLHITIWPHVQLMK